MKLVNYIKDVYIELVEKVSWPSWAELQRSAIVVMVASAIIATVIFVMDFGFKNLVVQNFHSSFFLNSISLAITREVRFNGQLIWI